MKKVAYSYWKLIKAGRRTFDSVPASVADDVKAAAREDAENGGVSAEEYEALVGEKF